MKPEKPELNSNQKIEGENKMSQKIIELFPEDIIVKMEDNGRWREGGEEENQKHIDSLAANIFDQGQLEPVGVRKVPGKETGDDFDYRLIFGFNRYEAIKLLNKQKPGERFKVKCMVHETKTGDKDDPFLKNMDENLQRKNLSLMDQAWCHQRLRKDYGWKDVAIADRFGISAAYVTKLKDLFRIPKEAQERVHEGRMTLEQAESLAKLQEDPKHQMEVFKHAEKEMLKKEGELSTLGATLSNDGVADPTTTKTRKKREPKINITASAQKLQNEDTEPSPRKMNEFRAILAEWEEDVTSPNLAILAIALTKILNGGVVKTQVRKLRTLVGDDTDTTPTPTKSNGKKPSKKDLAQV